jgi:type II secretory pathway component GspD/PulD (secretin)
VAVELRLVEISEEDQRALGFDWFLGNIPAGSGGLSPGGVAAPGQEEDETNTAPAQASGKVPVLGDLPVLGQLFRSGGTGAVPAGARITGILTDPQFRVVLHALEQRQGAETLSAPRITTLSARRAKIAIPTLGFSLDVLPSVMADGVSIKMEVDFTLQAVPGQSEIRLEADRSESPTGAAQSLRVSGSAVIWDGQSLVMGPYPREATDEVKEGESLAKRNLLLFITPTIIDPAGNRVHAGK